MTASQPPAYARAARSARAAAERTSDPWYDWHAPLSEGLLTVLADSAASPEEQLMAAEEEAGVSCVERARGQVRRAMVREGKRAHPERRILKKLTPKDRELLLLEHGHGMDGPTIAKVVGTSKQAVYKRQKTVQKRVAWVVGPGRLFNNADIWRDLRWRLHEQDVLLLKLLWGLRSLSEAAARIGMHRKLVRTRFFALLRCKLPQLADEDPERYGRYVEGFRALRLEMAR